MNELPERPFFIVGHPRSGTTLLRFILASHPRIFIPEETGFMPFLLRGTKATSMLTQDEVARILERIGKLNYLWRDKVTDISAFYRNLQEPNLACVINQLIRYHTTIDPVIRWGDKTPLYIQYIPVLNKIFPEAQFIHLIRDGRDAALSARHKWPERKSYMDIYYLLNNWVRNINTGRESGKWLGNARYHEVFYEKLVIDPEITLKHLCTFLGEDFHPAMLDHTLLARKVGPGPDQHHEVLKPISTDRTNRWKAEMTVYEKKLSDRIAGNTLRMLGYELANLGDFQGNEYLKYWGALIKFSALDNLRSFLYMTGLLTLNRTMRKA